MNNLICKPLIERPQRKFTGNGKWIESYISSPNIKTKFKLNINIEYINNNYLTFYIKNKDFKLFLSHIGIDNINEYQTFKYERNIIKNKLCKNFDIEIPHMYNIHIKNAILSSFTINDMCGLETDESKLEFNIEYFNIDWIDAEKELTNIISNKMAQEINTKICNDILNVNINIKNNNGIDKITQTLTVYPIIEENYDMMI